MNLLMISGDRSMLAGKQGAFWYTLEALSKEWDRIDVICPYVATGYENDKLRDKKISRNSKFSVRTARTGGEARSFFGNVYFHPSPYSWWRQPQWIMQQGKKLLLQYQHAVMTVHEYPPFYNGIGALCLSRMTKTPVVLEVHHIVGYPIAASGVERIGRFLSRWYLPWAIRRVAACRVVSKGVAETFITWRTPLSKLRVVPSFYLDREMIQKLGDRPTVRFDVVFAGRMVPNKGIEHLLHAMKLLPKATLLLVGDGPLRSYVEECARDMGILHRVEFCGWLPTQQDVLQAIRSAKMLVMNSLSEGGPRVPLEAMACGIPVIVTKVGVMPDVIEHGKNGFFTTGTPEDLAQKIQHLLAYPADAIKVGEEAKKILERFERKKLIQNYANFLKSFSRL